MLMVTTKRNLPHSVAPLLLIIATLWLNTDPSSAAPQLDRRPDGSVRIAGKNYPDTSSFLQSPEFREQGLRCGTDVAHQSRQKFFPRDEKLLQQVENCTNSLTRIDPAYNPVDGVTFVIPVWFHVITNTAGIGDIPLADITAQINVLNEDFAGLAGLDTSVRFELVGVSRNANDNWFNTDDETLYKSALAVDPTRYLNIYTKNFADLTLGYAYLPDGAAGKNIDGIVMLYDAIGGRSTEGNNFFPYNEGRTLVHEIGHYLGLFHTFQTIGGSCLNTYDGGDLITDTQPQDAPDYGCSASASCATPSAIDNFMNYSDDRCMVTFTAEQANRMICSLTGYRPNTFRLEGISEEEPINGLPIWLLYEATKTEQ